MSVPPTGLHFTLLNSSSSTRFGPRIGTLILRRPSDPNVIQLQTPTLLTTTSRGVVPHLSRDHYSHSSALKWTHVPFESFLEHAPPIPTLQKGSHPLHTFLGFPPKDHILSLSVRDPGDGSEMPTNGNTHVSALTLRGVRKVSPDDWKTCANACKPDILIALSDTPFTTPPYSQKRLTKSIERSAAWILPLLKAPSEPLPFTIFVHLAGNTNLAARRAFSESLVEPLFGPEAEAAKPFTHIDEGVSGYTFDLVPLVLALSATPTPHQEPGPSSSSSESLINALIPLLQTSLTPLPTAKPRLVNSTQTPHDILRLISSVGIDLFDAQWAQKAADVGLALDFAFPVRFGLEEGSGEGQEKTAKKRDLGKNLYDLKYAKDFSPLSDSFRGQLSPSSSPSTTTITTTTTTTTTTPDAFSSPICPCTTCSPTQPPSRLYHGTDTPEYTGEPSLGGDDEKGTTTTYLPPFTRAYVHHLLHMHEMSAHTLLVMHNLAVVEAFFEGVRGVLLGGAGTGAGVDADTLVGVDAFGGVDAQEGRKRWAEEVDRFIATYDESFGVLREAGEMWRDVDLARGKGRLGREKGGKGGE